MKGLLEWLKPSAKMKRWTCTLIVGVLLACYGMAEVIVMERLVFSQVVKIATIFVVGFTLIVIGIVSMQKGTLEILVEASDDRLKDRKNVNLKSLIYNKKIYSEGPRIVVIGGGSGLNAVIKGLRKYTNNITAIVTVSDYGEKSSFSRKELDLQPIEDIKDSFVALSDNEDVFENLFGYEFKNGALRKGSLLVTLSVAQVLFLQIISVLNNLPQVLYVYSKCVMKNIF